MADQSVVPQVAKPSQLSLLRHSEVYKSILVQPWTYITGAVLLAVFASALLQTTGGVWGVTTALTYWGGWVYDLLGGNAHSWVYFNEVSHGKAFNTPGLNILNHGGSVIDIAVIVGALLSTLLASQFKIKKMKNKRQWAAAIIGGLCMGFGARMSFGCNIGAMFSGLPSMSLHGWVFTVFIFIGAAIGSKLLVAYFIGDTKLTAIPGSQAAASPVPAPAATTPGKSGGIKHIKFTRPEKKENKVQLPIGIALLVAIAIVGVIYGTTLSAKLALIWVIGVALGFILQRSRFCFTAAMRDPVLTGGTNLTKAVVIALAVSSVLTAAAQIGAYVKADPATAMEAAMKVGGFGPVGIWTVIGATLFGIGAVLAGGCASGTLMRVGEGFMQQWLALPFFCLGGLLGAAAWPIWGPGLGVDQTQVIYLPAVLGGFFPALVVQFLGLGAMWLAADWWSKRKSA